MQLGGVNTFPLLLPKNLASQISQFAAFLVLLCYEKMIKEIVAMAEQKTIGASPVYGLHFTNEWNLSDKKALDP